MRPFFLELRLALHIDERGHRIWKHARRIILRWIALRLDEDRPARAKAPQRVVEPRRRADEFGWRGAIEIGPAETRGALEGAVLVQTTPGATRAAQGRKSARLCGFLRYSARFSI